MTPHVDTTSAQTPARSCDPELDRLLHPGRFYERVADVLVDAALTPSERRAILSAWASDACPVNSAPALRHAPFASQPVTFETIDGLRLNGWFFAIEGPLPRTTVIVFNGNAGNRAPAPVRAAGR